MSKGLGRIQLAVMRYIVSPHSDFLNGMEIDWIYRLLKYEYHKPSIARAIKSLEKRGLVTRDERQEKSGSIGENATDYLMPTSKGLQYWADMYIHKSTPIKTP